MPTCHPQRSIFLTFLWHFIWRIFIYYIQYILTFIPAIFLTCYRVFTRDPHLAGAEQTETMKTRFHHQTMANVRHNDTESRVDKHQRPQQSPIPTSLKITARQNHGTSRNLRNFHAAGVYGKTATTFLILHPTWSLRPCQTSCKSVCTPRGKWRMNVQCIIIYLSTITTRSK